MRYPLPQPDHRAPIAAGHGCVHQLTRTSRNLASNRRTPGGRSWQLAERFPMRGYSTALPATRASGSPASQRRPHGDPSRAISRSTFRAARDGQRGRESCSLRDSRSPPFAVATLSYVCSRAKFGVLRPQWREWSRWVRPVRNPLHMRLDAGAAATALLLRRAAQSPDPDDFPSLDAVEQRLHAFARHYEQIAQPFKWRSPDKTSASSSPAPATTSTPVGRMIRQLNYETDH
jgi:hypothetical protein